MMTRPLTLILILVILSSCSVQIKVLQPMLDHVILYHSVCDMNPEDVGDVPYEMLCAK